MNTQQTHHGNIYGRNIVAPVTTLEIVTPVTEVGPVTSVYSTLVTQATTVPSVT